MTETERRLLLLLATEAMLAPAMPERITASIQALVGEVLREDEARRAEVGRG